MIKLNGWIVGLLVALFFTFVNSAHAEESNFSSFVRGITQLFGEMIAPTYDEAKSACDELITKEGADIGIRKLDSEDFGTKSGKRFVVYQAYVFGEFRDRLCVHDGQRVIIPPLLKQSSYML